jgi:segregation and condensation protein A
MLDTIIKVKTDNFDGPLGLLLLLVQKEEMDVRDLDLIKITKQYLSYLAQMRELNFDVAGDYLYLASTLLLLKSKDCISEEEASRLKDSIEGGSELNIASQSELIRRLEELQHFQKMSLKLWDVDKKGHEVFVKPKINRKAIVNSILTPISVEKLTEAMMDFLHKEKRKYTVLRRDRLSIKEKLAYLKENLEVGSENTLNDLIKSHGEEGRDNTVITFISLLELARLNKIEIFQNESMGSIYINVVNSLDDFDVNKADGFEEETEELIEAATEEVSIEEIEVEEEVEDLPEIPQELMEQNKEENSKYNEEDGINTQSHEFKNLDLETPKLMQ